MASEKEELLKSVRISHADISNRLQKGCALYNETKDIRDSLSETLEKAGIKIHISYGAPRRPSENTVIDTILLSDVIPRANGEPLCAAHHCKLQFSANSNERKNLDISGLSSLLRDIAKGDDAQAIAAQEVTRILENGGKKVITTIADLLRLPAVLRDEDLRMASLTQDEKDKLRFEAGIPESSLLFSVAQANFEHKPMATLFAIAPNSTTAAIHNPLQMDGPSLLEAAKARAVEIKAGLVESGKNIFDKSITQDQRNLVRDVDLYAHRIGCTEQDIARLEERIPQTIQKILLEEARIKKHQKQSKHY